MALNENKKSRVSLFAKLSFFIFIFSLVMLLISRSSVEYANLIDGLISSHIRRFMANFGEIFSFSLFEIIVISLPIIVVLVVALVVRGFKKGRSSVEITANILAVALLLYSGNALALGVSYNTTSVAEKLDLSAVEVTEQLLSEALGSLADEINELSASVNYENGVSISGYGLDEASRKICNSYAKINLEYGFPDSFYSTAKGVDALHFMSYLRLGGIYTYYTGEANVNTDYPEFDLYFTAAHELSHQRGVMQENEANFMAYLALSRSDDVYLRYSAALNMFSYIGNALWRTNPDEYYKIAAELPTVAIDDLRAASAVTAKYGDTFFADISEAVNDLFLKSNGTDGTVTYGRVVKMYISYVYSN